MRELPYSSPAAKREYQRQWRNRRRDEYLARYGNKCGRCGSQDNLEFHHRNRDEKVSHKIWTFSIQRIEAELAKCDLLCMKCHFVETAKERGYYQYVHGTHTCYTKTKCRCELCRAANAEKQRNIPSYKYARQRCGDVVSDASSILATSTIP